MSSNNPSTLKRRTFLQAGAATAGACALFHSRNALAGPLEDNRSYVPDPVETAGGIVHVNTVCQMCHSRCGLRGRVDVSSGTPVLVKLEGNPYHPNNLEADERLPMAVDPDSDEGLKAGRLCPKGNVGIETLYDPYRLKNPLKRVGPRGSGKWVTVTWQEALTDIANRMRPYFQKFVPAGDLSKPSDWYANPDFPELGPVTNRVLYSPGRHPHGNKEFTDRWFANGFGTANSRHDHTSICETSHHVAGQLVSWDLSSIAGGSRKDHWKPDILNSDVIIWWGASPLDANFPMQTLGRKIARFISESGKKMYVVDPRFSRAAAKCGPGGWLPVKPGTDAALALGMMRRIISNGPKSAGNQAGYDEAYLRAANKAAANGTPHKNFCDATYLVIVGGSDPSKNGGFWRPSGNAKKYAVWLGGADTDVVEVDPVATTGPVSGELFTAGSGKSHAALDVLGDGSVLCKPVFTLLKERAWSRTLEEWGSLCGVAGAKIAEVADVFSAAGPKGVVNPYRGTCQNTNGTYNTLAVLALNVINGNFDWKGGNTLGGGHYHEMDGNKVAGTLALAKVAVGGRAPWGPQLTRVKAKWTDYPNLVAAEGDRPHRPWFPFAFNGVYQEVLPSIAERYPYPIDVLITSWNAWPYSTPAAKELAHQVLSDDVNLPLFVAFDIIVGETSRYADYILPETTYLEKWAAPHSSPAILTKFSGFRQPITGTYIEANGTKYYESYLSKGSVALDLGAASGPMLMDDVLIALGKLIDPAFPGVGDQSWDTSAADPAFRAYLRSAWDWNYNILHNWRLEASNKWSIEQIQARGGIFTDPGVEYNGDYIAALGDPAKKNVPLHLYHEPLATYYDPFRKSKLDGLPDWQPPRASDGSLVEDPQYPLTLVTYKAVWMAQARTVQNPTLMEIQPENFVELSSADGAYYGIRSGDKVRLSSSSFPGGLIGRALVGEGVRPGVVAVAHSYGHWESGAADTWVDGKKVAKDPVRSAGITANPICRLDPVLGNVSLQDPVGGSVSFSDTRVRVELVG